MSATPHLLIESRQNFVNEGALFQASAAAAPWRVKLRRCHGGRSEGVHVVEIDNGAMCIDVLPTRGMGIWRVRRNKQKGQTAAIPTGRGEPSPEFTTLGWQAPARDPVHPSFVPLMEPAGLGWLDGFNELLCRCGLESNGPPEFDAAGRLLRPLHGRIANTPARHVELIVDEQAGVITLRGVIDESRFHFQSLQLTSSITTKIGSNEFSWTDEVENIGGRDAMMQMLYHFNLGQPLLQPGARITAPAATVAPLTKVAADEGIRTWNVVPPPRPGSAEQVYVADLATDDAGESCVFVSGLKNNEAVSLRWNKRALPCFTLWRNTPAEADGYVIGLEPGTNFPNPRTFEDEQGRVRNLKPGEKWSATVTATWHTDDVAIADEQTILETMQASVNTELAPQPRPGWTPGV